MVCACGRTCDGLASIIRGGADGAAERLRSVWCAPRRRRGCRWGRWDARFGGLVGGMSWRGVPAYRAGAGLSRCAGWWVRRGAGVGRVVV